MAQSEGDVMSWHVQRLTGWAEFVEIVNRLNIHEEGDLGWHLRGQADAGWSLEPSLLRILKKASLTDKKAHGIEFSALRRFQSEAHICLEADPLSNEPAAMMAWWIRMQHHSCPTRLLDWTESPYVAAYFAVEQMEDKDGAIWFFPSPVLDTLASNAHGKMRVHGPEIFEDTSFSAVYPILPAFHSARSAAQQGAFTISNDIFADHAIAISDLFRGQESRYPLNKIIIPAELKSDFLSRLRVMNITAKTLFPGVDGLGRSAAEFVRLRVWRNVNAS